jgi:hypothetical protein
VYRQGSEHLINGEQFAMELHMVHYKGTYADQAAALASGDADALSVRKGKGGPRCISRISKPVDC